MNDAVSSIITNAQQFDATFNLKDNFAISLWNPAFFEQPAEPDKKQHGNGKYCADVLFSVWVYRNNKQKEVAQVANKMVADFDQQLDNVLASFHVFADKLDEFKKLDDGLVHYNPVVESHVFGIEAGKGCPIAFKLVRCFATLDVLLTTDLQKYFKLGLVSEKQFYNLRKELARPLRKFIQESTLYAKRFHQFRKDNQ